MAGSAYNRRQLQLQALQGGQHACEMSKLLLLWQLVLLLWLAMLEGNMAAPATATSGWWGLSHVHTGGNTGRLLTYLGVSLSLMSGQDRTSSPAAKQYMLVEASLVQRACHSRCQCIDL